MLTGNPITLGLCGILVGHSYHFLENIYPSQEGGRHLLSTPTWIANAFGQLETRQMTQNAAGYTSVSGRAPAQGSKASQPSSSGGFGGKGYKLGTE